MTAICITLRERFNGEYSLRGCRNSGRSGRLIALGIGVESYKMTGGNTLEIMSPVFTTTY